MHPNGEAGGPHVQCLSLPWICCFVHTLTLEVPDDPAKELTTISSHTLESLQSLMLFLVFRYLQDAPAGPSGSQKLPFSPTGSQCSLGDPKDPTLVSSLPPGPVWGQNLFLQRLGLQWEVEAGGGLGAGHGATQMFI